MTRAEFEAKAIRDAQRKLEIPSGWWGTYRDVTNGIARVTFTGQSWRVSTDGNTVSFHDSRSYAIAKARKQ